MQKKLHYVLILFLLMQIPIKTFAQCNPSIPNNANVVNANDTVNGGFTPQWVCKDDTLFSGGGIFYVYLETGAVMSTGGGIDSIYVKNGATLIMNGGIHVIIHEPAAILNVAGGIPAYYPCPSIVFDYTNAPLNGCFSTSVPEVNAGSAPVSVSPNPCSSILKLHSEEEIISVEIYNTIGEKIISFTDGKEIKKRAESQVDISSLQNGIYFVEIYLKENRVLKKIVKQ